MAKGVAGSGYFHWNYSSSIIIQRKGFDRYTNMFFAKMLYRYSYPYTPYDPYRESGAHMADNVRIQATKNQGMIVYQSKYAKYLHEGKGMNFNKQAHSLATYHWEQAAWRQNKEQMLAELDAYRKKRSKKNSG